MKLEQAQQKIFMTRAARLCVIGMQDKRYHLDTDYRDALDAVWEMIPDPFKLLLGIKEAKQ